MTKLNWLSFRSKRPSFRVLLPWCLIGVGLAVIYVQVVAFARVGLDEIEKYRPFTDELVAIDGTLRDIQDALGLPENGFADHFPAGVSQFEREESTVDDPDAAIPSASSEE
ncbi:MAG: hypothetical protein F4213_03365 [Boseongicola sp. SB0677_bin_26]|nr:hypothetical protein [Boseongicola sp. SB0665_bin_10]MYG25054.1 hypothetical protein [Boseongicola sp. SB0677_bin_26]